MEITKDFKDYEIVDMAHGEKLERWGNIILRRPDPQIIWQKESTFLWNTADAIYHRSSKGGGEWEERKSIPKSWQINYSDMVFNVKLMGFKHTGLFPEQAYNWNYMQKKIRDAGREIKVLNLFAYTGAASVACLKAGASVVHVDASKGMVDWAKENVISSGLNDKPIRYIVDDVVKFVEREIRRGNTYDAIIMDPPSFGRGSNGEIWDIEKDLDRLVKMCSELLSQHPLFFIINSYTASLSPSVLFNILKIHIESKFKGEITTGELGLPMKDSELVLPCGIYGRFEK